MKTHVAICLFTLIGINPIITPSELHAQKPFEKRIEQFDHLIHRDHFAARSLLNNMKVFAIDSQEQAQLHLCFSKYYRYNKQTDSARYHLNQSIALSNRKESDYKHILESVAISMSGGDSRGALSELSYLNGLKFFIPWEHQKEYYKLMLMAHLNLDHLDTGKHLINLLRRKLTLYPKDLENIAYCNYQEGVYFIRKAVYDSAFQYLYSAYRQFEEIGHLSGMSSVLSRIGTVHRHVGQAEEGLRCARQSIKITRQLGRPISDQYFSLGVAYTQLGQLDSALHAHRMGYAEAKSNNNVPKMAIQHSGLGSVFSEKKEWDSVLVHYMEATRLFREAGDPLNATYCQLAMSQAYAFLDEIALYEKHFADALSEAERLNNSKLLEQAYLIRYLVNEHLGYHEKALEDYIVFVQYRDSVAGDQVKKNIWELEQTYQAKIEKERSKNLMLRIKRQKEKSTYTRRLYFLAIFLLVAVLIILILLNVAQKRKLTLQIHKLNEAKNLILNKNKVIANLQNKLSLNDDTNFADQILENINSTGEWARFMIEFNTVYGSFYDNLNKIAKVNLSNNDRRIAALIKLNLSNKEMADLLYISVPSVKKAKSRLLQKLSAKTDGSLHDVISAV